MTLSALNAVLSWIWTLILGMFWLERHEPWINWRSKTFGATRNVSSEALERHEHPFAIQQKRYWRKPQIESISVIDIRMSELVDSEIDDIM